MTALFGPWSWAVLAVLLAGAELFAPGVFLIWLAVAAGVTAAVVGATGIGWEVQLVLFGALSVVSVMVGRSWLGEDVNEPADTTLNRLGERVIGRTVVVIEAISHGRGRVQFGDSAWTAEGPDLPAGAVARIVSVDGNILMIEPAGLPERVGH